MHRPSGAAPARLHPPNSILRVRRALPAAMLLALVAACGGDARDRAQGSDRGATPKDTIAIGVALDPARPGMESIYQGVELAVAELNAGRGMGPVIVMRRTPENISSAIEIATRLQRDPSVVGVVGHPESGTSLEALPVYEDVEHGGEHAVAIVSPTATSAQLTGRSKWFFRICPTDVSASEAVARYVLDSLKMRRASVIYRNDSYGRDWTKSFAASFRAAGGTVLQSDPYVKGATEWDAYAAYIRKLGVEVLLFPGSTEDAVMAIRALRAAGAGDVAFVGGDAVSGLADEATEFAGARYTSFFDALQPASAEARTFIASFQRTYDRLPDQRAALAYDAATLIGLAIRDVGTDRRKIRDAIARVGSSREALDGAAGRVVFDGNQDAINKSVVITTVGAR